MSPVSLFYNSGKLSMDLIKKLTSQYPRFDDYMKKTFGEQRGVINNPNFLVKPDATIIMQHMMFTGVLKNYLGHCFDYSDAHCFVLMDYTVAKTGKYPRSGPGSTLFTLDSEH